MAVCQYLGPATGSTEEATTHGQTPPTSLRLTVCLLPGAGESGRGLRLGASVGRVATPSTTLTRVQALALAPTLAL